MVRTETRRVGGESAAPESMRWIDAGGSGRELVFLHANGYPPACYARLLGMLSQHFLVRAIRQRPLWDGEQPQAVQSWHPLSGDLLNILQQHTGEPATVVGHSLGAIVALRAAMSKPGAFSKLVLLDPVLVGPSEIAKWRILRVLGFGHRLHGTIRRALARRRTFDDLDLAFETYRRREVFSRMDDDALRTMVAGMFRSLPDGQFGLIYSPEWEARLYSTAIWNDNDLWRGLRGLLPPTLIVRGTESDTLSKSVCIEARAANESIAITEVEGASHLLPLERPEEVMQIIREFIYAPGGGRMESVAGARSGRVE